MLCLYFSIGRLYLFGLHSFVFYTIAEKFSLPKLLFCFSFTIRSTIVSIEFLQLVQVFGRIFNYRFVCIDEFQFRLVTIMCVKKKKRESALGCHFFHHCIHIRSYKRDALIKRLLRFFFWQLLFSFIST